MENFHCGLPIQVFYTQDNAQLILIHTHTKKQQHQTNGQNKASDTMVYTKNGRKLNQIIFRLNAKTLNIQRDKRQEEIGSCFDLVCRCLWHFKFSSFAFVHLGSMRRCNNLHLCISVCVCTECGLFPKRKYKKKKNATEKNAYQIVNM